MQFVQIGYSALVIDFFGWAFLLLQYFLFGVFHFELAAILVVMLLLMYRIVVRVTDEKIRIQYGLAFTLKTILPADVIKAQPLRLSSIWSSTIFNISGFDGVEVFLKNKTRCAIQAH